MPQIINTNVSSLTAQRNLNRSQSANQVALQRLSSGLRINSAKDDAAGLAISTRFEAQVKGLNVAMRNAGDGISLAQTAEGALGSITESLQRMRELALQSSNATNSDLDRESINAEAQQLISEIARVSDETNFNGVSLLNGDFTGATFQIGANTGETISFDIEELTTSTLGAGTDAGASALGTSSALASGDLVINGSVITASVAADDNASTSLSSASAIAKAAAINKSSDSSGVQAEVLSTVAAGTSMAASAAAGSITLNGVSIALATGGNDTAADRVSVLTAINAESDRTGVIASDGGSDSKGVILTASDGRNIDIDFGTTTITASATGLQDSGNTQGGYTLTSVDRSSISIEEGTGTIGNSGIIAGTYDPNTASVSSVSTVTSAALASGDLVINGVVIGATLTTDDNASSTAKDESAIAKVAAVNRASDDTGVSAAVATNVAAGASMAATAALASLVVNGVTTATFSTDGSDTSVSRDSVLNAINAISGQTGVVASDGGSDTKGVVLSASDGRNIDIDMGTTTATATTTGIASGAYKGSYTLTSAREIEIAAGTGTLSNSGLSVGTYGGAETGDFVKDLDLTTVAGAQAALISIDNALDSVNASRGDLGAIQNRFDATIANLEVNSENLSAAKSRISDADFAKETAQLTRTQVLQQAGISILAQANASSQNVLSLLQ